MHMMVSQHSNASVREAAVAGLFYPGDAGVLREDVQRLFESVHVQPVSTERPKALIAPHAGYIYSGGVAAAAYDQISPACDLIRRVVLVGPSHRVYFQGVAISTARAFATPLGEVEIDVDLKSQLLARGDVLAADAPHALEHSLEVHLPFLQVLLNEFTVVPLVTGVATPEFVADVLNTIWGGDDTLIVASSDLSHYLPYAEAQRVDAATNAQILARSINLTPEQACGALPINAVLAVANARDLDITEVARLNSGDTAGDRDRVVGYGAYAIQ
jgi:MEMO1 family protein